MVVVIPHWGTQYTHVPEASQRRAARAFADAGADLVIGGHPHWVQGWETRSATPWSCTRSATSSSTWTSRPRRWRAIFVEVVLWGGQVKAVEPVPYALDSRFVPRVVKGDRAQPTSSTTCGPPAADRTPAR